MAGVPGPKPYIPEDHPYPTWRYHKTEDPVRCQDAEAVKALGPGWTDIPGGKSAPKKKPEEKEPEPKK